MKLNDAFPTTYVSAADLKGREIPLVIKRVEMVELRERDGGVTHKPACYFQNAEKGLILNITNWNLVAALYGDESDNWVGREVILYPAKVPFGKDIVDAVRIKGPASAYAAPGQSVPSVQQPAFGGGTAMQAPIIAPPSDPLHPGGNVSDMTASQAIDDDVPF